MKDNVDLNGKTVAILAADGCQQFELELAAKALAEKGARNRLVSLRPGKVYTWSGNDFGNAFNVDDTVDQIQARDFDALVVPGGVMHADRLRQHPEAIAFVRGFFVDGKPVAASSHGVQVLIDADVVDGRRVTSSLSIRRDLANAGANWVNEPVVVDRGLVTGRSQDDMPSFCSRMIEDIAEGINPQGVEEHLREGEGLMQGSVKMQPEQPSRASHG